MDAAADRETVMRAFVEDFALTLTSAGMQRMAARVFAALLAADSGSMTARELAEVLQVSPAAVSGAVRYLEQARMAVRARRPGERVDHYALAGEGASWYETSLTRSGLVERMAATLADAAHALGPQSPAGRRLAENSAFFEYVMAEMRAAIGRWHELRGRAAEEPA